MYTRQQGASSGKILLQPNKPTRTEKVPEEKESAAPESEQIAENKSTDVPPTTSNEDSIAPEIAKKPRYHARRPKSAPVLKEKTDTKEAPEDQAEKEPPEAFDLTPNHPNGDFSQESEQLEQTHSCVSEEKQAHPPLPDKIAKKGGLSSLFDSFNSDEILILAIIILLIMQGSDDILVLALCFIVL